MTTNADSTAQGVTTSAASTKAQTKNKVKKTVMKLPASFTLAQLMATNNIPEKRYNTVYQRVRVLVKKGELKESATIKNGGGKGRAEIVYSRPDASENNNLLRKAAGQGRLKSQGVVVPVEAVAEPVQA
jgi:hypothetical protein